MEERVDVKVLVPDHALHRVRLGRHAVELVLYVLQEQREGGREGGMTLVAFVQYTYNNNKTNAGWPWWSGTR